MKASSEKRLKKLEEALKAKSHLLDPVILLYLAEKQGFRE